MDSTQQKEATSHLAEPSNSTANVETKVLRSSARVKAAKEKEKEKERASAEQQPSASSSSSSKRSRETATAKGKGKEVDEAARATKRCVCSRQLISAQPSLMWLFVIELEGRLTLPPLPSPLTNQQRTRRARNARLLAEALKTKPQLPLLQLQ